MEGFAEALKADPILSKLIQSEKEDLMKHASDYVVEKVLSHESVLGEGAKIEKRAVTTDKKVKKGGFAAKFQKSKSPKDNALKPSKEKI